jgi:hypothetical protein
MSSNNNNVQPSVMSDMNREMSNLYKKSSVFKLSR